MKTETLIWLFTLSVQVLNVNSNACRWLNDGSDCVIQCADTLISSETSGFVQAVYDNFTDCHSTGVKLILSSNSFTSTLRTGWLQANIHLTELEMDGSKITTFQANVFQSSVFVTVKKLNLKNIRLWSPFDKEISKNIFVGLVALEELMVTKAQLIISDNGWLDNINGTMKSLVLTGMGGEPSLIIEKLTGGSAGLLSNIEYVKIEYNLLNSIDDRSFTAIPNVRELDLSKCGILTLSKLLFEKLGSNLRLLSLEQNRLTALPVGIFSSLNLNSSATLSPNLQSDETSLTIWLGGNPWNCNCSLELEYLQDLLKTSTNFAGEILCAAPDIIVNYPIRDTVLCPAPITTEATTEGTTLPIDNTTLPDYDEKECPFYNDPANRTKISIKPQMQRIRLNGTLDGLTVMLDEHSTDLILIWFKSDKLSNNALEYYQNPNTCDCFANLSSTIHIKDLEPNTSYTLCLMNITEQSVSPLDCISYHHQGKGETLIAVFLYGSSKPLAISIIVIACIANIIIGVIIGVIFMKCSVHENIGFRCWKREAINSQLIDDFQSKSNASFNPNNDRAPPLPPHPLRDLDDDEVYYYTTVK